MCWKELSEYLKECQGDTPKKHVNVNVDHPDDDVSTETDSESDFDENVHNDEKESRDIFWD